MKKFVFIKENGQYETFRVTNVNAGLDFIKSFLENEHEYIQINIILQ